LNVLLFFPIEHDSSQQTKNDVKQKGAEIKHDAEEKGKVRVELFSFYISLCWSGAELKEKAGDAVDAAKEKTGEVKDAASEKFEDAKETGAQVASDVSEKAGEVKDAAEKKVEEIKPKVEEAKEAGAQLADDASKKVEEVKDAAQENVEQAKEAGSEIADDASKKADEAKTTILETATQAKDAVVEKAQEIGQAVSWNFVSYSRLNLKIIFRLLKAYKLFLLPLPMQLLPLVKKLLLQHTGFVFLWKTRRANSIFLFLGCRQSSWSRFRCCSCSTRSDSKVVIHQKCFAFLILNTYLVLPEQQVTPKRKVGFY
jgi:hypothetical protein